MTESTAHWVDLFNKEGVPGGPIYGTEARHLLIRRSKHLGMQKTVHSRNTEISIWWPSRLPCLAHRAASPLPPAYGEHTDEILGGLGMSEEIQSLRDRQVI